MLELLRKIVHIVLRVVWSSILGTSPKTFCQDPTTEHGDGHFCAPYTLYGSLDYWQRLCWELKPLKKITGTALRTIQ